MKRWLRVSIFITLLIVSTRAVPAESDKMAQLDEALKAVGTFEYGKDSGPLVRVEQMVIEAAKDAKQCEAVEQRIVAALGSASSRDAKSFLCRQLRTIGTARCVPQLESLLTDAELSHMARYALGSIEDPAAIAALHRALGKTSGKLQVGILNTLANQRYHQALPDMVKLLHSSDSGVAEASARALGRLGGAEAVEALEAARPGASKPLRERIDNALLVCADQLLAEGRNFEAVRIYNMFYLPQREKRYLRLAGLQGLVAAWGEQAIPLLSEAIKGADPALRRDAIGLIPMVKGDKATEAFAALLPSLPPDGQALVLGALGARGESSVHEYKKRESHGRAGAAVGGGVGAGRDRIAVEAVAAFTKSSHEQVRLAAIEALGSLGGASAVPPLAEAATAAEGREKLVARASLVRLPGVDVNGKLVMSFGSPGMSAEARAECIRALADRGAAELCISVFEGAKDNSEVLRREAIRALGLLVDEDQLQLLIELAARPKDPADRPAIEQAIVAAFRRGDDKNKQAKRIIMTLSNAPVDAKPTLLRLLSRPATPKALEAARAALADGNAEVRDAAVRSLSEWPDAAPAEELLELARGSADRTHKVLALRGYVRMAGMSENPAAMYAHAMELAERPEDKKLVLAGLGNADSAQALAMVEQYLTDEQLQAEAALAAVQIASRLRQSDAAAAKAALKNVIETVKDQRIRQQAQDVINEMEQYEGYILVWLGSGPYTLQDKESRQVFDTAFGPEKPEAEDVKWRRLSRGIGSWDINLESTFGGRDHCAAYVRTSIWSPKEQAAQLELGSDDAIKAWLNGKLVHENYASRGLAPRQDIVKITLQKGQNQLILKVVDHEGGWAFCCRVRKPDGSALDGLKVEAK